MIEKIFARIQNGVVVNTAVSIDSEINLEWFVESFGGDWVEADNSDEISVGWVYSEQVGKFIPPKPFDSWILNEATFRWEPPIPYPNDGAAYQWDESLGDWVEVV